MWHEIHSRASLTTIGKEIMMVERSKGEVLGIEDEPREGDNDGRHR